MLMQSRDIHKPIEIQFIIKLIGGTYAMYSNTLLTIMEIEKDSNIPIIIPGIANNKPFNC